MASRPQSVGFGFVPSESEHHFLVMIPSQTHEPIYISEHVTWVDNTTWRELHFALGQEDAKMRVVAELRFHHDFAARIDDSPLATDASEILGLDVRERTEP